MAHSGRSIRVRDLRGPEGASVALGGPGATPAERSGQIHRCRTTSRAAVRVPRAVLATAGGDRPGVPVDVQPHAGQDPEALAEREAHVGLPSGRSGAPNSLRIPRLGELMTATGPTRGLWRRTSQGSRA